MAWSGVEWSTYSQIICVSQASVRSKRSKSVGRLLIWKRAIQAQLDRRVGGTIRGLYSLRVSQARQEEQ